MRLVTWNCRGGPYRVKSRALQKLAVWAMPNDREDRYVRGVVRAVDRCASLIAAQSTVLLVDFNSNTRWDSTFPRKADVLSIQPQRQALSPRRLLSPAAAEPSHPSRRRRQSRPVARLERRYRRFAAGGAESKYEAFASEILHRNYDAAALMTDGLTARDLSQLGSQERIGGGPPMFQTLFPSHFAIDSRKRCSRRLGRAARHADGVV